MTPGLVSVIVPVFNGARFLRETLDAVLGQTHASLELICIDDGSTDGSRALVQSYGPRVTLLGQRNAGGSRARNTGFAESRGEYLAFLDQDDVPARDKIARQVALLRDNPADDVVVCDGHEFDGAATLDEHLLHPELARVLAEAPAAGVRLQMYDTLLEQQPLKTLGQTLIRRRAFERVGTFSEERSLAPDHEWFLRHAGAGAAMRFHADRLLAKRYLPGSRSGARERRPIRYAELTLNSLRVHRASAFVRDPRKVERAMDRLGWKVAVLCLAHSDAGPEERKFARQIAGDLAAQFPAHPGLRSAAACLRRELPRRGFVKLLRFGLGMKRRICGVRRLAN